MPSRFFAVLCAPLLLSTLLLSGCGYHTLNSAAHLPSTVHTLAIPSFKNNTQSYHTQAVFTQAVIREFNSRSSLRIVSAEDPDADVTLRGTILTFTDRKSTRLNSSHLG